MVGLANEPIYEPYNFRPDGFNGKIPMYGGIGSFWECPLCGNATEFKPEYCVKCNFIHFWHIVHHTIKVERYRDDFRERKVLCYA